MTMSVGHAETAHRVALEVEFDQHHRLFAHHPTIVAWFDGHDLRRLVFGGAPVAVFDVDLAPLKKADVRVHATVRADDRLHVDRPAKSGRIDHALHASCAVASDLELDMADLQPLGSFHAGEGRTGCLRSTLSSVMPFRNPAGLPTGLRPFRRHGRSAFQRPFWNQSSSLRERQTRWAPALRTSGTAVTRRLIRAISGAWLLSETRMSIAPHVIRRTNEPPRESAGHNGERTPAHARDGDRKGDEGIRSGAQARPMDAREQHGWRPRAGCVERHDLFGRQIAFRLGLGLAVVKNLVAL